jgi:hypothetical protein
MGNDIDPFDLLDLLEQQAMAALVVVGFPKNGDGNAIWGTIPIPYDYLAAVIGDFEPVAPNNFVRMPLPSNAQACSTNTGVNFNAPPGFSVSNIAANGRTNGLLGASAAVGQGGYYDFQRVKVGSTTQYFPGYTPVSNIAVGAYLQGAGVPQWLGGAISNTYALVKSSNGPTGQQATFRNLGFSLASGKATYSCQAHP